MKNKNSRKNAQSFMPAISARPLGAGLIGLALLQATLASQLGATPSSLGGGQQSLDSQSLSARSASAPASAQNLAESKTLDSSARAGTSNANTNSAPTSTRTNATTASTSAPSASSFTRLADATNTQNTGAQNANAQTTNSADSGYFDPDAAPSQSANSASTSQNASASANTQPLQEVTLDKITDKARGFDSKLDELNRNVYIIDKSTIENKGFKTTEEVFDYIPFVGKSNVGLGSNLDLRGQGASSNVNVQVLLNGTNLNMLDSAHGVTPINTIAPTDIERIEILPGGGAVMYGNGTRGGVINIITKKRYDSFSPSIGVSYKGTPSSKIFGSEVSADARVGGKLGSKLYYTLSGRYLYKYGYRVGDESNAGNVGGNLTYDINDAQSLSLDVSYFTGITNTSPNSLFSIGTAVLQAPAAGIDNSPTLDRRYNRGEGTVKAKQNRADVVLTYDIKLAENHKLQAKAFYHYFKSKYLTYDADLYYRSMWVDNFNQDGSYFADQKAGLQLRYDWKQENGIFIAGFDSIWNKGDRQMDLSYRFPAGQIQMGHDLDISLNANKWTNSIYAIEKYHFTEGFSLTGGARYENAAYFGERNYRAIRYGRFPNNTRPTKSLNDNISNFALEITPRYQFANNNADVYFKYERGFRSPNPDNLTIANAAGDSYVNSNVKSEYYHTAELGSKAQLGKHVFISGALFYTLTENEIYSTGTPHSGLGTFTYGNYDYTQRFGVELFSEQAFFDRSLRFSESFTYIDSKILRGTYNGASVNGNAIPYVANYKGTIGINWDFSRMFGIWTQNSFVGNQYDRANRKMDAYILTDLGIDAHFGDLSATLGVRNLFDTAYFMYYNSSTADYTTEYSYLYAPGRSFFLDLRYAF